MKLSFEERRREQLMAELLQRMDHTPNRTLKRHLFRRYRSLHAQRSRELVRHMEIEKGLARA